MPIVGAAKLHWSSTTIDEHLVRKHKMRYQVFTDSPDDTSALVSMATGIGLPIQFVTPHPHDPYAVAKSLDSCERSAEDPNTWHVDYTFDNASRQRDSSNDSDPANFDPEFDWGTETRSRLITKDIDGNTILNAAGDPREPLEIEDDLPVLSFVRPEMTISFSWVYQYNNSVNSDNFYGAAPGTLRVKIHPQLQYRNLQRYWKCKYSFRYRPEGWQPKPLEAGVRQLIVKPDPNNPGALITVKVECTVKGEDPSDSDPVTSPVPLDISGQQIDPNLLQPTPSLAVYTEVKSYKPLPYAALNL